MKTSVLEIVGDIKKAYSVFAKHIRETLDPCQAGIIPLNPYRRCALIYIYSLQ